MLKKIEMAKIRNKKDLNLNEDRDMAAWEGKGGSLCGSVVGERVQGHEGYGGPVFLC